jgi:hypothetical protein
VKTFASCMQCLVDNGRPSYVVLSDYFDDGIALMECSAGHKTALVMQSQKFQMLLDSGASALLERFTLEACASFAAALERFYEFSLRVAFAGRQQSGDLYEKMFSEMARQSERQRFCSEVYEIIRKLFNTVHAKYADSIGSVVREESFKRQTAAPKGVRVSISAGGNLFSIMGEQSASFSEALDSFRKQREMLKAAAISEATIVITDRRM